MLIKHLRLAQACKKDIKGLIIENGDIVELSPNKFRHIGHATSGKIFLDETATDLHEGLLKERRKLAYTGLIVLSLVVDRDEGRILEGPNFNIRGVSAEVDLEKLKAILIKRFGEISHEARRDHMEVETEFRRITRSFFKDAVGIKPVVIPIVYEI